MNMADNNDNDIVLNIEANYTKAIEGMAKYRKTIDETKEANAKLRKDLKNNLISQDDYNKAISANSLVIDQCNEKTRALRKEIQNNIKIEQEQKGSIISLQAQIAKLSREYEKLGDSEENYAKKTALSEKINELQVELNRQNEARGRSHGSIGKYEDSIKNALGLNNEFANSILNLAKNAETGESSIGSFFSNAGTSVKAFGKTLMGLMTNPVFLAIAGIVGVGVAFKFWYDYNKGLVEATKLTKDFTGLAGNELKAYRNEIQGVADTFGKDFKEVLESTNAVAKRFGISQQEALGYIKDGFIAGADANGDYLNILKEYPAHFKEAGLSASKFIAIVSETNKAGVFSDKGIDAIKEANTRLREMSTSTASALNGIGVSSNEVQKQLQNGTTTTFEVMQKVSEKLNEYPAQSKKVGTAIADIFGGAGEDAGLQYLKTLKDIDTNLDSVKSKAGELAEIQERQMNANIELQNTISALFDQTGGTFESMIGNAKVFVTEWLTKMIKGLIDIVNWFIDLYNKSLVFRSLINGYIASFKNVYDLVGRFFTMVIDSFKTVAKLINAIFVEKSISKFFEALKDHVVGLKDHMIGVGNDIADNINEAIDNSLNNKEIKKIEIPTVVVPETIVEDDGKGKVKGGLSDAQKKAIEDEKKAQVELAKFKLETEAKSQKEIADNKDKEYTDRLSALNAYYANQRILIEADEKQQLAQKNLTASQIALIKAKSNQQILDLDKEIGEKTIQIMKDDDLKQVQISKTNIQNKLAIIKQGGVDELNLKIEQLRIERDLELESAEKLGADKEAIKEKYRLLEAQELEKQNAYIDSQRQKEWQNEVMQAKLKGENTLAMQIEQKVAEISALSQLENESDIDFLNRKLALQTQLAQLESDYIDHQTDTRVKALEAISTIAKGLEDLFSSMAEDNEAMAVFAKAMALYQIGLDTATALTAGIAASQKAGPFPANLVAIATTVATVLANIAKAKKMLTSEKQPKKPSFATGGLITGAGSGTSDSIDARLSNGESVLTARATQMFAPILSSFNQIGGGVPIATQDASSAIMGEDILSRALVKAVSALPNPVVAVSEIKSVNNRVETLENSRNL